MLIGQDRRRSSVTARDAYDLASLAKEQSDIHIAVCEQQNIDILRRLGTQDKILWFLVASALTGLCIAGWDLLKADLERQYQPPEVTYYHQQEPDLPPQQEPGYGHQKRTR